MRSELHDTGLLLLARMLDLVHKMLVPPFTLTLVLQECLLYDVLGEILCQVDACPLGTTKDC